MMMNTATINQAPPAIIQRNKAATAALRITDLECIAKKRQDRTANICIRGKHYLVVKHVPNAEPGKCFKYQWRHVKLTREGATLLLDGA